MNSALFEKGVPQMDVKNLFSFLPSSELYLFHLDQDMQVCQLEMDFHSVNLIDICQ